jgi:hypothetical protein
MQNIIQEAVVDIDDEFNKLRLSKFSSNAEAHWSFFFTIYRSGVKQAGGAGADDHVSRVT